MDNLIQMYCSAHIYGQDFFLIVLLLRNPHFYTHWNCPQVTDP